MVAVRAAQARNHNIPADFNQQQTGAIPAHAGFKAVVLRDQGLADNLIAAARGVLKY
jgi:hypothetical protein